MHDHSKLSVGMSGTYERTVTEADIVLFAKVSGDHNPVHLDEEYAKNTRFGGRIAHGMLSGAFISTAIASELPGPGSIYVSQLLNFRSPVRLGETVRVRVTITGIVPERARVMLATVCAVGDRVVVDGTATVMVPPGRISLSCAEPAEAV